LDAEGAARKTAQPVVGKVETSQQSVVDEGPKQDMPNRQTPDPDVVGTNVVGTNVSQRNSGATNSSNPKTKRDESFAQTPAIGGGGGLIPLAQSNPLPAKTAVNERTENNEHPSVESSQQTFPPEISGTVESESAQHAAATSPFAGTAGMSGADSPRALPPISDDAGPLWWKSLVASSLLETNENTPVDLDQLILMALSNSPRIIAISQDPLIEEQEIVLSQSKFDPALFTKTQFDSRNDPVGNTLTTGPGGAPFLQDKIWSGTTGVRKKMQTGAAVDLSQKLGFHNSNSQFFSPQDQGTATLSLNFNQPLLRGGGRMYNQSRIILAQSFADTAWQRYYTELQGELLNVAEAYWRLYFFRCQLVQRQFSVQRAEVILAKLEIREGFDSLPNQIVRARAALQARRTSLANAVRDVRNAETTIRKLTAMSNWSETYMTEMIPAEAPQYDHVALPIESVVDTALELRPEIKQALQRAKSASIQSEISRHELLPELNLLLGSYVAGLEGRSDIPQAFSEQFSTTPGYYAGLEFNLPYRNRAAQSVHRQRMFKLKAIRAEVDLAVQEVVADAQTSVRKLNSAYATLVNSHESLLAARKDLEFQQRRWQTFALVEGDFAEGQNATILLEQLLDSQQRLTQEELAFSQAELDFKVAQIYLKKALGTLLQQASPFAGLADENQP
jgi:outer membrane protein TolC